MRAAKREDYRRALSRRRFKLELDEFSAPPVLGAALPFAGPITVICGPNGAGKTRLLRSVAQTLGCDSGLAGQPLTSASSATLKYRFEGTPHSLHFSPTCAINADHGRAALLEPAHYAISVLYHLRNTSNISELLESYAPREFDAKGAKRLSYLVNRRYDTVESIEVDDPGGVSGTPDPMPYFRVSSLGRSYGSDLMGLGELSVFCLWWNLDRIEPGSVVLIDEPEAFTSPHTQYALVDELVRFSVERELTFVLATQSQQIVDSIDGEAIRMLLPSHGGVTVEVAPPRALLLSTLGIVVPKQGVVLVEDEVAKFVATTALGVLAPELLQLFEFAEAGGTGPLEHALQLPGGGETWFHLLGIFDGDQRNSAHSGLLRPFTFLPGNTSPEAALRASLENHKTEAATALGRSSQSIAMAIVSAAGMDGHDWLRRVGEVLGIAAEPLVAALTRIWLEHDRSAFDAFIVEIRNHLQQ